MQGAPPMGLLSRGYVIIVNQRTPDTHMRYAELEEVGHDAYLRHSHMTLICNYAARVQKNAIKFASVAGS